MDRDRSPGRTTHRALRRDRVRGGLRGRVSSTRNGFPFGLYVYLDEGIRERELFLSNVPLWDSLSFTFLTYLGYATALTLVAPLEGRGLLAIRREPRALRSSRVVLVLGAFFTALVDIAIDPVTLRGERWFLGKIYEYAEHGVYFGVPLSNFAGWFLVALVSIAVFQEVDRQLGDAPRPARPDRPVAASALAAPVVYVGVYAFVLSITFAIGERTIGWAGLFLLAAWLVPFAGSFWSRLAVLAEPVAERPGASVAETGAEERRAA